MLEGSRNSESPTGVPDAELGVAKQEMRSSVRSHIDNLQEQIAKILKHYGASSFEELQRLGEQDHDLVSQDDIELLTELASQIEKAVDESKITSIVTDMDRVTELVTDRGEKIPVTFNVKAKDGVTIVSFETDSMSENISDAVTFNIYIGVSKNPDPITARKEAEKDLIDRLAKSGLKPVDPT